METSRVDGKPEKTWQNWRRKALAGVGDFSKEEKSLYNKEKWLPLCRDTQFLISNECCHVMKKQPLDSYMRKEKRFPIMGILAEESRLREQRWLKTGCNAFEGKKKTSQPLSFWTEQDILHYIEENDLEIASVYGEIVCTDKDGFEYDPLPGVECDMKCTKCDRSGCIFCGFGAHLEKGKNRFQRLAETHPKQYDYCMRGGQWVDNPHYDSSAPKFNDILGDECVDVNNVFCFIIGNH